MKRFDALESWRGIAACLVALYHMQMFVNTDLPVFRNSYLFVDFFFVLSGFVIAANYEQRLAEGWSLWRFALLRFGRLYPLHLALLGAWIVVHLAHVASGHATVSAFQPPRYSADTIVANLLLVQGMHLFNFASWNQPSWTISAEFYTYLIFALAVVAAKRRIVLLLLPAILAAAAALWLLVDNIDTNIEWGLIRCICGFASGVLVWHVYRAAWLRSGTALELAALALVVAFVWRAGRSELSFAAPAVFALAVVVFAAEAGPVSRLLRAPALLWVGARSYSIYMVHFLVGSLLLDCAKLLKLAGIGLYSGTRIGRQPW
ncbi:MAG TPA: acyltransferase, partial [Burkholderiales bacterium]|nr:acyltransferase [Burkholderiales bacterium]